MRPLPNRIALAIPWTGLILLSSTETAIGWAYWLYDSIFGAFEGGGGIDDRFLAQKLYHVCLFVVLAWLLAAIPVAGRVRRLSICILACVAVGIVSEAIQLFVSGRQPTLSDAMLNGLTGVLFSFLWVR